MSGKNLLLGEGSIVTEALTSASASSLSVPGDKELNAIPNRYS